MKKGMATKKNGAMKSLRLLIALSLLTTAASAAPEGMRLEERMLFRNPDLAKPGACVMYREGGAGWILTEPLYWLRGTTVRSEVKKRRVDRCPEVVGKAPDQYARAEFNRLAKAQPCVEKARDVREEDFGAIVVRIDDWETPWAKRAANAGRLYQGYYIDKPLKKGNELEFDANLLATCR